MVRSSRRALFGVGLLVAVAALGLVLWPRLRIYLHTARYSPLQKHSALLDTASFGQGTDVGERFLVVDRGETGFDVAPASGAVLCNLGSVTSLLACRITGKEGFDLVPSLALTRPSESSLGVVHGSSGWDPMGPVDGDRFDVAASLATGTGLLGAVLAGVVERSDGSLVGLALSRKGHGMVVRHRAPDAPEKEVPLQLPLGGSLHDALITWDRIVVTLTDGGPVDHVFAADLDGALDGAPSYRALFDIPHDDDSLDHRRSRIRACRTESAVVIADGGKLLFARPDGSYSAPHDVAPGALYCHGEVVSVVAASPASHTTCTDAKCVRHLLAIEAPTPVLADLGGQALAVWRAPGRTPIQFRLAAPASFATAIDQIAIDNQPDDGRPRDPDLLAFELASGPFAAALFVRTADRHVHVLQIGADGSVHPWKIMERTK